MKGGQGVFKLYVVRYTFQRDTKQQTVGYYTNYRSVMELETDLRRRYGDDLVVLSLYSEPLREEDIKVIDHMPQFTKDDMKWSLWLKEFIRAKEKMEAEGLPGTDSMGVNTPKL